MRHDILHCKDILSSTVYNTPLLYQACKQADNLECTCWRLWALLDDGSTVAFSPWQKASLPLKVFVRQRLSFSSTMLAASDAKTMLATTENSMPQPCKGFSYPFKA